MRRRLTYVALAALVLLAAGASSTFAARGGGNNTYVFNGRLLAEIAATAARGVAVRGPTPGFAHRPLWLFVGTLNSPAASGKVSIHVQSGNWLGLRKMLGQPLDESFSYGPRTIFILWRSGVPTVISPSQLRVGDRISVRIRAPRADSLQQAEQVPATHIGDHEPHTPS